MPGAYQVNINATDGTTSSPRSGVRSIDFRVNDESVDIVEQECPAGSCPLERTFWLNTTGLPAGQNELAAVATDWAGNTRELKWSVTIEPQATAFEIAPGANIDEVFSALQTAGKQWISLTHLRQGGYDLGNESPVAAADFYRSFFSEEYGAGTDLEITGFTVGGIVSTEQLGSLAGRVTERLTFDTSEPDTPDPPKEDESLLEYLDDLLNQDLFAETQAADSREEDEATASAGGARRFAPTYGGIDTRTDAVGGGRGIVQSLTFSKGAIGDVDGDGDKDESPFERSGAPDHGYEHDLKLFDPGYIPPTGRTKAPFCKDVSRRFWAQRKGMAWSSNFPGRSDPYKDENFAEDCDRQDFTIGVEYPLNLTPNKKYTIVMKVRKGSRATSPYQLRGVQTFRGGPCPLPAGNCNADTGTGVDQQLLVGDTKGRAGECRRWRKGRASRKTCDR